MKVMKFGGTSVGSAENILRIKTIVEAQTEPVIVVVSALGGVTDQLLETAKLALEGDKTYEKNLRQLLVRHRQAAENAIPDSEKKAKTLQTIELLFAELSNILKGVFWVRDLSQKTSDAAVSYGERLSSIILAAALKDAKLFDTREIIKTEQQFKKHIVDFETTNLLIKKHFEGNTRLTVIPGFISQDIATKNITNLGRGGSDYTASIIAAALNASILEIWTDVDGFMTANPKIISAAYVIKEMSFIEAMELSNFGATVIYPPTIYPAYHRNIPIQIRNTFNPTLEGTYISRNKSNRQDRPIKGISSIGETSLITIQGLGMVGVLGINSRIFGALSASGVSVFMVCQASSENTTTLAVKDEDATLAVKVLKKEFAIELEQGEINEVKAEQGLSTVAVVGENIKHTPGISGKLFGALGRSGISVIAYTQGASETNISFVIESRYLRKALNTIHDSFFLSEYQVLNIFIAGTGTVGGNLLEQIKAQQKTLKTQNRLKLNVVGIANTSSMTFDRDGIDLETYRPKISNVKNTPETLRDEILNMNIFNPVFVDCTASREIAALYKNLLDHNISVVAANKIAASSEYKTYANLKETARQKGVKYLFETNVGAGLPIINTMNALNNSGDKILELQAVLSGTLNFIFNTISPSIPLSRAIKMATEKGFAEPDPRIDLDGTDVLRKLVILAREAGYQVSKEDVEKLPFIPDKYLSGTINDFWETIPELDDKFEEQRKQIELQGKRLRFVAAMDKGKCRIGPQEVDSSHPFYELEGSNNIIMITTERYNEYPMIIKGYGAGAAVTAAGVFADIISIANIR
ncbi:MAG: bifunctional aspartate kinase/homoserine dehydrogenase I [Dysgonamonadaceae bacterium]|jgi:aspartokinase/homoserine dehydrogenase 1|nr:bifunctional aspartate kinase/homoserine dehydrogenase I [Dysgonamonadaceae bacterium]